MTSNYCCLCVSDEGVFLDIFAGSDKTFSEELETCLSIKVNKSSALSTKICHKCAFELDQCNEFIKKYKKFRNADRCARNAEYKSACCVCFEPEKKEYIFELSENSRSRSDSLSKIDECFEDNIAEKISGDLSICLECRYSLDVLCDLRNISREANTRLKSIAKDRVASSDLPKTETIVVNRKTTFFRPPSFESWTSSDSDDYSRNMARGRPRAKKITDAKLSSKQKLRVCDECRNSVPNGSDMYRFHRTHQTVCKSCWITMDPLTSRAGNKRKKRDAAKIRDTKLCTVFLKDVLSASSLKDDEKVYKVEKDDRGNVMFVVTDESSECGDQPLTKRTRNRVDKTDSDAISSSAERASRVTRQRSKKSKSYDSSDEKEDERGADIESRGSGSESRAVRSPREMKTLRAPSQRKSKRRDYDEITSATVSDNRETRSRKKRTSTSDADSDGRSSKRVKIVEKMDTIVVHDSDSDSSSSSNNGRSRRRGGAANRSPPTSSISVQEARSKRETRAGTRSSSISSQEAAPSLEFKSPSPRSFGSNSVARNTSASRTKSQQSNKKADEPEVAQDAGEYTCKVCGAMHENKLAGITHELTHSKQLEIKLHKMQLEHVESTTSLSIKDNESEQPGGNGDSSDASDDTSNDGTLSPLKSSAHDPQSDEDAEKTAVPDYRTKVPSLQKAPLKSILKKSTLVWPDGDENSVRKEETGAIHFEQIVASFECEGAGVNDTKENSTLTPRRSRENRRSKDNLSDEAEATGKSDRTRGSEDREEIETANADQSEEVRDDEDCVEIVVNSANKPEDREVAGEEEKATSDEQTEIVVLDDEEREGAAMAEDTDKKKDEEVNGDRPDLEEDAAREQTAKSGDRSPVVKTGKEEAVETATNDNTIDLDDGNPEEATAADPRQLDDDRGCTDATTEIDRVDDRKDQTTIDLSCYNSNDKVTELREERHREDIGETMEDIRNEVLKCTILSEEILPKATDEDARAERSNNETEEKDLELESDNEIKIVDTGSSENSLEHDLRSSAMEFVESTDGKAKAAEVEGAKSVETPKEIDDSTREREAVDGKSELRSEQVRYDEEDESAITVSAILEEVFDSATKEVESRTDDNDDAARKLEDSDDVVSETLENISREVNSVDMPSLDPDVEEIDEASRDDRGQ